MIKFVMFIDAEDKSAWINPLQAMGVNEKDGIVTIIFPTRTLKVKPPSTIAEVVEKHEHGLNAN